MVEFHEVTTTKERKSEYLLRHIFLPQLTHAEPGSPEADRWIEENWWMMNFSVFKDDKPRAQELARELDEAFRESAQNPRIPEILEMLRAIRHKDRHDYTSLEIWTDGAYQMVDYAGGYHVHKMIRSRLQKYSGNILEAMCGHISYLEDSDNRTITALDYCELSLEKYPFPKRRRICCDLDQIRSENHLHFFKDEEFDAISICFGYKYPKNIVLVAREFRRILRYGGVLSFIENPEHGYKKQLQRNLNSQITNVLQNADFREIHDNIMPSPEFWQEHQGEFHHIEAIK
jgi:SAM-dependent methyltransferase